MCVLQSDTQTVNQPILVSGDWTGPFKYICGCLTACHSCLSACFQLQNPRAVNWVNPVTNSERFSLFNSASNILFVSFSVTQLKGEQVREIGGKPICVQKLAAWGVRPLQMERMTAAWTLISELNKSLAAFSIVSQALDAAGESSSTFIKAMLVL